MNFYATAGAERQHLAQLAAARKPDVILCHFGHVALRLLPIAEEYGIPLVAHFHGLDVSSSLRNRWYRWSLGRALRRFAGIVVVGAHQRQWMLEHGVAPDKVHLIPCGVPTDQFVPAQSSGRTDDARYVTVSRLVAWKGVDYLVQAFAVAQKSLKNARLSIVGDGPERKKLQMLAKDLGVSDAVSFNGMLPVEEVRRKLLCSDVYAQHSLDHENGWIEGFGVSIAEASATGLPVVVTRCGGITDQVIDGFTGFVVPQRDSTAMGQAMIKLSRNPDLRLQMGHSGRTRMVEHFDTTRQVRKLEDVLLAASGGS